MYFVLHLQIRIRVMSKTFPNKGSMKVIDHNAKLDMRDIAKAWAYSHFMVNV